MFLHLFYPHTENKKNVPAKPEKIKRIAAPTWKFVVFELPWGALVRRWYVPSSIHLHCERNHAQPGGDNLLVSNLFLVHVDEAWPQFHQPLTSTPTYTVSQPSHFH
jgi:hypothetical protein